MKTIIFKDVISARKFAKTNKNTIAVEAEYGQESLEMGNDGVVYEMNHHGSKQHYSAPCSRFEIHGKFKDCNFIVSHIDLDTIMGIALAIGALKNNSKNRKFAKIAEFVDVYGLHRLREKNNKFKDEIDNFQYYIQKYNKVFENGEEITSIIKVLITHLKSILEKGVDKNIVTFFNQEKELNVKQFELPISNQYIRVFKTQGQSLIFEYDKRNIILQLNENFNAITLCVYDENIAKDFFGDLGVIKPLKDFFGENAGGKITIGGGDRNKKYYETDLIDFCHYLNALYIFGFPMNTNNIENFKEEIKLWEFDEIESLHNLEELKKNDILKYQQVINMAKTNFALSLADFGISPHSEEFEIQMAKFNSKII